MEYQRLERYPMCGKEGGMMIGEDCEREWKMERIMVENKNRGKSSPVEPQPELWQQTQHWKGKMIRRIVLALDNSYDGRWDKGPSG